MDPLSINTTSNHSAIAYAAEELARGLTAVGHKVGVGGQGDFRLGLIADDPDLMSVDMSEHVDEIVIETTAAGGVLAGSNCRSVLFAVYAYLNRLGFAWIRPGADGEIVPPPIAVLPEVSLQEKASYRYRGVCIEGASSLENAIDMVDWMAKVRMNTYFIQFADAFTFFERWYTHQGNPSLPGEHFDAVKAQELTRRLREEIKRRGMDLHMIGHGWTCEPFGISGNGWFKYEGDIPDETRSVLAEIDGVRGFFKGIPLNTNLCYGNPAVREIICDAVLDWAEKNPDVDVLHFWLADDTNNQCECPLCRDIRPAEFYVEMLNCIDEKLSERHLKTRIAFLVYLELLWPPETRCVLNDPDRFVLMFAPITRSYASSFSAQAQIKSDLPAFERNALTLPKDPSANIGFLREWQRLFPCEGFDFDYHLMWHPHRDAGMYALAEVLHKDIVSLRQLGLDGLVSCQSHRVFFPSGLGMTVLAQTLWNRDLAFEDVAQDYFSTTYGDSASSVRSYFAALSELFNPELLSDECPEADRQAAARLLIRVPEVVNDMGPVIERGEQNAGSAQAASWKYLKLHGEYACLYADAIHEKVLGNSAACKAKAWELVHWAREHELALQPVLDLFELLVTLKDDIGFTNSELEIEAFNA